MNEEYKKYKKQKAKEINIYSQMILFSTIFIEVLFFIKKLESK